jgi:penicillin-binding protein 1A
MDVAAKTGTTNGDYDRWLCGFTEYYTAATWYGYDTNEAVTGWSQNPAGQIWDAVMTDIHAGLTGARFNKPSGIVNATICKDTGMLATDKCTSTYSEIFVNGTVPKSCDGHGSSYEVCKETGKLANEYCPEKETKSQNTTPPKEKLNLWKTISSASSEKAPTETCDVHKKSEEEENKDKDDEKVKNNDKDKNNTTNTTNTNTTNTNTTNNTTNSTTNSNTNKNTTNTTTSNNTTSSTNNTSANTTKNETENKTTTNNSTNTNKSDEE